MTEEEREEAFVSSTKAEILHEQTQANQTARRTVAKAQEANERMRLMNEQLLRQQDMLNNAERNMAKTHSHADVGGVNLDDLDAANKSMFNFVANSKGRIAARAEKKMTIAQQHQELADRTFQEEHDLDRKWQVESQKLEAARPKELLGAARKKTDFSQFEFEDDDGQQRENNEEWDRNVDELAVQTRALRQAAEFQGFVLDQQVKQMDRMTDQAQAAGDKVGKNVMRLNTKYNLK